MRYNQDNIKDFWEDSEYAFDEYTDVYPTDSSIESIEKELGYKLPASYIDFMRLHNGGIPKNSYFATTQPTSWAPDHIAITGLMGIGSLKDSTLTGNYGSKFWISEWGYPNIGIYICDTPSAGHDMILLDYSKCGAAGEPQVVHIDQELDYKKTFLAKDFLTFIHNLEDGQRFEE